MLKFSFAVCLHCPEERQDSPGQRWGHCQGGADGAGAGTEESSVCVMATPACGWSKSCLGCPCRGCCEESFAFSHNIVLCVTHAESLMISENGALPSMEVLTASSSSGYYSYSTYFYGTCMSFNFSQGVLFCFPHQKIKFVGLSLEHAEVLRVQEWWGGM